MQIKIDLKILIFVLIFWFTNQFKIYILLMIFACIHELSHLLIGMILGFKPEILEIKPIGFSISFKNSIKDYNIKIKNGNLLEIKKILVYAVGPIINILLALIIFDLNINQNLKIEMIYTNIILAIINLIPIYPLDGGRILKSIICVLYGIRKSYTFIDYISNIAIIILLLASSILILYFKNIGILVGICYLMYIKIVEFNDIHKKLKMFDAFYEIK